MSRVSRIEEHKTDVDPHFYVIIRSILQVFTLNLYFLYICRSILPLSPLVSLGRCTANVGDFVFMYKNPKSYFLYILFALFIFVHN